MTYSAHTSRTVTAHPRNYGAGRAGTKIDRFVLHHIAGTLGVLESMVTSGSRRVSPTYGVGSSGEVVGMVREEDTPFTNGHLQWNRRSITFEVENQRIGGNPYGKPSPAAHEAVARVIADASERYGIALSRDTVATHRELRTIHGVGYATACPGDLDRDWIVARARELRGQGSAPAPISPAAPSAPVYPVGTYNGYSITAIQRAVGAEEDGIYGPETASKVRLYQAAHGLVVDGIVGPITWGRIAGRPVEHDGSAKGLDVDGKLGPLTVRELQRRLDVTADGIIGPVTIRALQRLVGTTQDGILGPITRKALQARLGVAQDGIWGPITVRALQSRLNSGNL